MNGVQRIQTAFETARGQKRAALILYYSLGYPTPEGSLEVIHAAAEAGADIIELGVPFSDPLADGPTIQYSTQVALEHGMSVARCLTLTRELRSSGAAQNKPLLLMGYINPILAYGIRRFVADAAAAGVDGLIVPDLPPEESGELDTACREAGLALVYLLSPASPPRRIDLVAEKTTGFLYLISLTGVTGARSTLAADLPEFIARARAKSRTPIAVGFGISTPAQAKAVGELADGVIVGSALINTVRFAAPEQGAQAAREFVSALRDSLHVP